MPCELHLKKTFFQTGEKKKKKIDGNVKWVHSQDDEKFSGKLYIFFS